MSSRGDYTNRGRGGRGRGGPRGRGDPARGGPPRGGFGRGAPRGAPVGVFSPPRGRPAPDAAVTRAEDAIQASKAGPRLESLSLSQTEAFPIRPGYGTKGKGVVLWANYITFSPSPSLVLHRYDVAVAPQAVGRKMTQAMRLLLESPDMAPFQGDIVTDFKSTLISQKRFEDRTVKIAYRAEGEDEPKANPTTYTFTIQHTNVLSVADLVQYLTSTNFSASYDAKLLMIQAFNILRNHYAKSTGGLAAIGASKTFAMDRASDKYDLGGRLTAVRGFFASVRAATTRVLVNVNVSHGAFYQEGPLELYMAGQGPHRGLAKLERFIAKLRVKTTHLKEKRNARGDVILRVKTIAGLAGIHDGRTLDHPPKVPRHGAGAKEVQFWLQQKPSAGAAEAPAVPGSEPTAKKGAKGSRRAKASSEPQATSAPSAWSGGKRTKAGSEAEASAGPSASGGRYISVYDFFLTTYGMRISDPAMPIINVGTREKPTYLPAQVCYVLAGQPAKTKLDSRQTQSMIRFAVRPPEDNAKSIMDGLAATGLSNATNPLLARFGIQVGSDLITVNGRVLIGPNVLYKSNKRANMMAGGWNMVPRGSASLKFSFGATLSRWSCLCIDIPGDSYPGAHGMSESLEADLQRFVAVLIDMGMSVAHKSPPIQRIQLRGDDDNDGAIEKAIAAAAGTMQLLFIILPSDSMAVYSRIKQLGDIKYGVHTVCSVGKKLAKQGGQDQYFRNVALKFNLKLGGSNQVVEPMQRDLVNEDKTMVVGIDVTHPSPGSASHAPSIAGMVANVDRYMSQWPAVLSIQPERKCEMVSALKDMLISRLRLWRSKGKHASLPENILVYRDGVSEGQYQLVLDDELPLLRAACREVYSAGEQKKGLPRLTIVVVGKRHHTRFYPTSEEDMDRSGNTRPGTVVDRGVTEARSWDFFLQAHTALQGTARPGHYFVALDEIFRARHARGADAGAGAANELQELTQNMCYVFGRATKAVSICTPAYYADIVCERARCYLSSLFEGSSSASVVESVAGAGAAADEVTIHERLRDSMFYI